MTEETYDILRASGLVPALVCRGCGNIISPSCKPWPGDGYVTHPNARCSRAALNTRKPEND